MAYIGSSPTSTAFVTDSFNGNASTTVFTMSVAPANPSSALVAISGVLQDPTTYAVSGTSLTFSSAPPLGTGNISVRYLGIPASGITTTAYRTLTEFTATAGQTTFSPPSYSVGYINVYRNGSRLGTADFTATNGTSVVLNNAAGVSDLIAIESFYITSVTNALPQTGGVINAPSGAVALQIQSNSAVGIYQDSSANVGIGTSPSKKLHVVGIGEIIRAESATGANDQLISVKNNSGTSDASTNIFFADRYGTSSYVSSYIRGTSSGTSVLDFATGGTNFTNIYDSGQPTVKMRITAAGLVDLGVGGGVGQIRFPSTQVPSSDPNTLDDYEEGTWTPTFSATGLTYTQGTTLAKYVKVGRIVTFTASVQWSGKSGGTGNLSVSLPFAASGDSGAWQGNFVIGYSSGINVLTKTGYNDPGSTGFLLTRADSSTSLIQGGDLAAGGHFIFGGTYQT